MNIFFVDKDPVEAAHALADTHVRKMILESGQLLATAHWVLDGVSFKEKNAKGRWTTRFAHPDQFYDDNLIKPTHINHPCAVWIRADINNYYWLFRHFMALLEEYNDRFDKPHKWDCLDHELFDMIQGPPLNISGLNDPDEFDPRDAPVCMPDEYKTNRALAGAKTSQELVFSYRNYYSVGKKHLHKYTKRQMPNWVEVHQNRLVK